jgi:hypothetical protein
VTREAVTRCQSVGSDGKRPRSEAVAAALVDTEINKIKLSKATFENCKKEPVIF